MGHKGGRDRKRSHREFAEDDHPDRTPEELQGVASTLQHLRQSEPFGLHLGRQSNSEPAGLKDDTPPDESDATAKVADGDGEGEWEVARSKKDRKRQKTAATQDYFRAQAKQRDAEAEAAGHKPRNYPGITSKSNMSLSSPLKLTDFQQLVLYILSDATAPQWIAVRSRDQFTKVVVLMVPGLERAMFENGGKGILDAQTANDTAGGDHGEPNGQTRDSEAVDLVDEKYKLHTELGSLDNGQSTPQLQSTPLPAREKPAWDPDRYIPFKLDEDTLATPLKPMAGMFSHLWPVQAAGDDRGDRIYSPVYSMLTSSTTSKSQQKNQQKKGKASDWIDEPTPVHNFVHGADELLENEYVVHPALFKKDEERVAHFEHRMEDRENKLDGWVDSNVPLSNELGTTNEETDEQVLGTGKVYAIDCEMCKTTPGHTTTSADLELTRISVVNWKGGVVMDELVKPQRTITDYLTQFSGITKELLEPVRTTLSDIQHRLTSLLRPDSILVGHSLNSDLLALKLTHPNIIDTSIIYPHPRGLPYKSGLKWLTQKYLDREIQKGGAKGHDSVEDARACMELLRLKCAKGPKWGTTDMNRESIFTRLSRTRKVGRKGDEGCTGAVVDWGNPERMYGSLTAACIGCQSDTEVVEGVKRTVNGDSDGKVVPGRGVDLTWARLRNLETVRGWWNANRKAAIEGMDALAPGALTSSQENPSMEKLHAALTSTVADIASIYESLPPCTTLMIYSGTGDPREMGRLLAVHQQFKREYKVKKWDELTVKWTDEEEQALRAAKSAAKWGVGFITVK